MSESGVSRYIRTRARFYRLRDAKILNCWVEWFSESELVVRASDVDTCVLGEEYQFEIPCYDHTAGFRAILVAVKEAPPSQLMAIREDSIDCIRTLQFELESQITKMPPREGVRHAVQLQATIRSSDAAEDAMVIDISPNGVGLCTKESWAVGTVVRLVIHVGTGFVVPSGYVRYCRSFFSHAKGFRVGVMFTEFSEDDRPRWIRLLEEGAV